MEQTIELFEFGPSNNYSSITLNDYDLDGDTNTTILTARHIGGDSLTSSASTGWDARATQGATLGISCRWFISTRLYARAIVKWILWSN